MKIFLSLGTNVGDRLVHLDVANSLINTHPKIKNIFIFYIQSLY